MSVFDKLAVRPPTNPAEPERRFIEAVRAALKEYDRATKPDGRRRNGGRSVDPKQVRLALTLLDGGMTIRQAAKVAGISFGTLWKAKQKRLSRP